MRTNFFTSKGFLSVVFFIFGLLSMFAIEKVRAGKTDPLQKSSVVQQENSKTTSQIDQSSDLDQLFGDDFFQRSNDPFEAMREMRKKMFKSLNQPLAAPGVFDSWYQKKFGGGAATEITKREDKDFVYYDIALQGLNNQKLNVKVENAQINISGQLEKQSVENGVTSFSSSSFHRSFPVPPHVDANNVVVSHEKEKIILKFPKTLN